MIKAFIPNFLTLLNLICGCFSIAFAFQFQFYAVLILVLIIEIFMPLGVPIEYSCRGCFPTGSVSSYNGPAVGLLILAKVPPFWEVLTHTLGGT